ncbi:MAG: selenide, water dikinase SelD, partial [Pseudomonadota bacterium]
IVSSAPLLVCPPTISAPLAIGFTISAAAGSNTVRQNGAQDGDVIVLTKPIGTGVMLAAEMRQMVDGDHYHGAIESMLRSQATASSMLAKVATAMTDVTGFGLAGHLLNILLASNVSAHLESARIPVLNGATEHAESGIRSTLWSSNMNQVDRVNMPDGALKDLFFDPQTCGGLLATVPEAQIDSLMSAFAKLGEPIWRIGRITSGSPVINVSGG